MILVEAIPCRCISSHYNRVRLKQDGSSLGRLELCGINGLQFAELDGGFSFEGPIPLGDNSELWRDALTRDGRLHELPPDMARLFALGARHFAWLRPREEIAQQEREWPHGAFVFLYERGLSCFDCIFKLTTVANEQRGVVAQAIF